MIHTLALIPGLNTTAELFDAVAVALPADIRAMALDNPALDSVEDIARAHLAQLPKHFWLAGFAFGGFVALAMLELAPRRVLGLALVCSAPGSDSPAQSEGRNRTIAHANSGGHLDMVRAQAAQAFHPDNLRDQALMDRRMEMAAAYGSKRFIAHQRASANRVDRRYVLDGQRPTLLISGSHDPIYTPDMMLDLAATVRGCECRTIERSGHMVPLEQPLALGRRLALWIGANQSGSAVPDDTVY